MLKHIVTVQNRKAQTVGRFGIDSGGIGWQDTCKVHVAVDFVKGMRAMNVGAIDVYGVVMVRMRWTSKVNERSRIVYDGNIYKILPETFHADRQANTIQFNAQMMVEQ